MPRTTTTADTTKTVQKLVKEEIKHLLERHVTRADVQDVADQIVRSAIREQARALEKHLRDINERLTNLEQRRS